MIIIIVLHLPFAVTTTKPAFNRTAFFARHFKTIDVSAVRKVATVFTKACSAITFPSGAMADIVIRANVAVIAQHTVACTAHRCSSATIAKPGITLSAQKRSILTVIAIRIATIVACAPNRSALVAVQFIAMFTVVHLAYKASSFMALFTLLYAVGAQEATLCTFRGSPHTLKDSWMVFVAANTSTRPREGTHTAVHVMRCTSKSNQIGYAREASHKLEDFRWKRREGETGVVVHDDALVLVLATSLAK